MPTYHAKVFVTLKPSILDPQGRTVERALSHLDYANVSGVRIGKYIELTLTGERTEVETELAHIVENVLSNPIMENARWELEERPA
ncbi:MULTISPECIES: phosphoribosylformylglycinamidine synthase subunit PurS [Deinococcus]|uniref:Phosphoribosylformylglycinamidine synthase subunit PurS n=1 Tax=Deinococcus geothermalis (strain DSM 11300 / CIP 105573 / AG-3a) TaxID=319795 RepID=Q1J2B5_DEIGD|nr:MULTISPECIES: phosphoribosylformylglycinamidine synthase subunit PurS [Deinococcus]ABF44369.1 phosphoribosylformylglycinamidine synthetase PurS [Deinococcus geothermalis DSM 11300]MBI0446321.1 phosphoribosylformylglycinamidine synthase subunit PurS [Deinococcus sp. DB0503]TDE86475.1 phosphoribosylformylglycinamidine synthase subunit PurS [Deinococcus sp. S9]